MASQRLLIDVRHVGEQIRLQIGDCSATLPLDRAEHLLSVLTSVVGLVKQQQTERQGTSTSYDTERPDEEWLDRRDGPNSANDT